MSYNWVSLGCGVIANQLAQAMEKQGRTLYGVVNRTYSKAVEFAEKYNITNVYKNIDEVFRMKKIGILMGSDSDLPVVEKAMTTLDEFGVPYEVHVYSAHRTPAEVKEFTSNARENGFGAIIAAAGKAAHLAGAIAASTTLPVIGIPVKSSTLDGLDALLSTVQMPGGIPVATVAIDGAQNAALLAIQMLGIEDSEIAAKLDAQRKEAADKVLEKNKAIEDKFNR